MQFNDNYVTAAYAGVTVSKRMKNTVNTITTNVQRIGYRGRRMKKEQMMLQPSARK
jgi:hypothetical protein